MNPGVSGASYFYLCWPFWLSLELQCTTISSCLHFVNTWFFCIGQDLNHLWAVQQSSSPVEIINLGRNFPVVKFHRISLIYVPGKKTIVILFMAEAYQPILEVGSRKKKDLKCVGFLGILYNVVLHGFRIHEHERPVYQTRLVKIWVVRTYTIALAWRLCTAVRRKLKVMLAMLHKKNSMGLSDTWCTRF